MNTASQTGLSADTQALMAFESSKKSTGVAYLLWFFTGGFGGHRFYLGRTGSAVGQLILNVLGWCTVWFGVGVIFFVALGIWLLIDLFTIPGMIAQHNGALMSRLNASSTPAAVKLDPADELTKYAALKESGAITQAEFDEQKARIIGKPMIVATTPSIVDPD
jgi:TM2 domain-containing membrane protein YozV